ncbi:MAG: GatB/YqeY domain-containing protein [Pseudomonadota bacterium]
MSLKTRLQEDMKNAMRAQDKGRLSILRFLLAAIKQREVDERIELDDMEVLKVIEKLVKQHHDSVEQYKNAGREELAEKELFELDILKSYLPEPFSDAEILKLIQEAIQTTQADSMKDMGKVINCLRPSIQGRADMSMVSAKIKQLLSE